VIQMLRQLLLSYLLLVIAGTLRAEANTGSPVRQTDPNQVPGISKVPVGDGFILLEPVGAL
jgi:hypothetical protein